MFSLSPSQLTRGVRHEWQAFRATPTAGPPALAAMGVLLLGVPIIWVGQMLPPDIGAGLILTWMSLEPCLGLTALFVLLGRPQIRVTKGFSILVLILPSLAVWLATNPPLIVRDVVTPIAVVDVAGVVAALAVACLAFLARRAGRTIDWWNQRHGRRTIEDSVSTWFKDASPADRAQAVIGAGCAMWRVIGWAFIYGPPPDNPPMRAVRAAAEAFVPWANQMADAGLAAALLLFAVKAMTNHEPAEPEDDKRLGEAEQRSADRIEAR